MLHACMRVVRREPTGSALFLILSSLNGMARSAAILRSAVYNAMHNEPMSPKSTRRDYRCDGKTECIHRVSPKAKIRNEFAPVVANDERNERIVYGSKSSHHEWFASQGCCIRRTNRVFTRERERKKDAEIVEQIVVLSSV